MATEGNNILLPIIFLLPFIYLILKNYSRPLSMANFRQFTPSRKQPPILGNLLQDLRSTFLHQTGNSTSCCRILSSCRIQILKKHDRILSGKFVPHVAPTKIPQLNKLSLGWIAECNAKWKYLRTICKTELFSSKALESQAFIRETKVMEMVEFIKKFVRKEVKIKEIAKVTFFNMLSCILVSRNRMKLDEKEEKENGDMKWVLNRILEVVSTPNLSDFYPILGRFDLQGLQKKIKDLHQKWFQIFEGVFEERRNCKKELADDLIPRDFLDTLITNGSTNDQIYVLLMELMSAGTDTMSNTIELTMAELIKNPECLKKVEEEIITQVTSNLLKESHISHFKYLEACVIETLRLHPPGPFQLPHRATTHAK